MGFPILVRRHHYIESRPWGSVSFWSTPHIAAPVPGLLTVSDIDNMGIVTVIWYDLICQYLWMLWHSIRLWSQTAYHDKGFFIIYWSGIPQGAMLWLIAFHHQVTKSCGWRCLWLYLSHTPLWQVILMDSSHQISEDTQNIVTPDTKITVTCLCQGSF